MSDEVQQRRVLRPVELTAEEAALAYDVVCSIDIPGVRVKPAASLLTKIEAAMVPQVVPVQPTVEETERAFSETSEMKDD